MSISRLVRTVSRLLASVIGAASLAMLVSTAQGAVITNDVFWKDTSGNNIYSQGGGVFKFGSTYYWYGVKYAGAALYAADPHGKKEDTTFQAITCYSSTDLVNWKFENNIVTSSTPGLNNPTWFGRLGVFYNASTARYVCVSQYFGGLGQGNIYFTGTSPTGNFSVDSLQYPVPGVVNNTTGDQTVFTDTDGQSYLICSSSSGRSNWYVARFNTNGIGTQTAVRIGGGTGREGNCMFKYNGRYYFCSSDLYGWNASRCYYISATNIMGPYGSEAVMTNSATDYCHVTQTGFFVTVAGTQATTVLFCGDRWADFAGNGNGYNQWCPLTFSGTTPIFNSLSKWDFNATTGTWSVAAGNNYVLNPTYEADRVVQSTAVGWTTTSNSGNSGGNGNGRTGDFFFQHTGSATTRQTITGLPNGAYTLTVWHRSGGGQTTCRMFARNYGGSQLNTNLNTAASGWTQRTISGINVTNGSIEVGIESSGGWVNFDDWELTGGGTPANNPPSASITSPVNGATFTAGANITINATASDSDGTVTGVQFFHGSTSLGTDTSSPYSVTWNSVPAGNYTLTARATDDDGAQTTSTPISITVGTGGGADTYQAESGAAAGGVTFDTNNPGFNGTGFANFPATGGTLTFNNVDGNGGGTKSLAIRYANGGAAARAGTITVNGAASSISFAPTGGWSTWTTLNVNITLNNSPANTIQFASTGSDLGNIDEITVP